MSPRRTINLDSAKSSLTVAVASAIAQTLICGFDLAAEDGVPLTQLQRIAITKAAVMSYDEAAEGVKALEADHLLAAILQDD